MLRRMNLLLLISATILLVHAGDAAFRSGSPLGLGGGRGGSRQQYRNNYNYRSSNLGGFGSQGSARSEGQKTDGVDSKGSGAALSAWGIVAIVVGVILLGLGGYYAFVLYPFVCRKERNYDMIELTNVL